FSVRCICSVSALRSLPLKIPFVSASCCFSFGSTVSCKCRISFALSCAFIISFCMVRNSAISISRTGFGGISCSRIKFCRKSLALFTILRNRPGSQPLLLIDWLAFSCISVCLTSKIFASEIPDNNAISAVLFHSCLAALIYDIRPLTLGSFDIWIKLCLGIHHLRFLLSRCVLFLQPFTVVAVAAAAVTAPYHTPQAVDTEAPCKGEIPGVQIEDLCEGCISLSNAEGLGL